MVDVSPEVYKLVRLVVLLACKEVILPLDFYLPEGSWVYRGKEGVVLKKNLNASKPCN